MRDTGVAHLIEHGADLLHQPREPVHLRLFWKQQATARRDNDIIAPASEHQPAVRSRYDDVARRELAMHFDRRRLHAGPQHLRHASLLTDNPRTGAGILGERGHREEQKHRSDEAV